MKKECAIIQEILPLYEEDLLQQETKQFVNQHLQTCEVCRDIAKQSEVALIPANVKTDQSSKKMIRNITLRLTTIQVIFVAIAFLLAMTTSVMNGSKGYILSYTLLGAVTFLFYRSGLVALLIAAIPTILWSCLLYMTDLIRNYYADSFLESLGMVAIVVVTQLFFTGMGIVIGFCIRKVMEEK
ncbi:MAG: zf-HC2 domain-containing protein [Kurthia sp.]|nr:zf-HC2 domain-containing protein [Candidatus Kurthia equi]